MEWTLWKWIRSQMPKESSLPLYIWNKELAGMRQDFKDLTTYTAQLEHRNYQMIDNMHSQMMAMPHQACRQWVTPYRSSSQVAGTEGSPQGGRQDPDDPHAREARETWALQIDEVEEDCGETEKKECGERRCSCWIEREAASGLPEVCQAKILGDS